VTTAVTAGEERLIALASEAPRGPRQDGLYALWLTLRVAEGLLPPDQVSVKNHRRRLQALEQRLGGLALPAPLKRALVAARHHLEPGTPRAAALVLQELLAPTREVLGSEAEAAVAVAARAARVHL
jgi:hypothetical protein